LVTSDFDGSLWNLHLNWHQNNSEPANAASAVGPMAEWHIPEIRPAKGGL
jgi:hypothetical protein